MIIMGDTYQASYRCLVCGADRTVGVRYREHGEDIIAWMNDVVRPAVARDHVAFQPMCPSENCDLKLPMPAGTEGIGCRVKQ